jgi:hypothetical protein
MKIQLPWRRRAALRQVPFAFMERSQRIERRFKLLIVIMTCCVITLILRVMPWGRYASGSIAASARQAARQAAGIAKPRSEIDDYWRRYRQLGIEQTRKRAESFYERADPAMQRMLQYAGMDPEQMLLRWGNYNWTLLLSSKVFEVDDTGRSFRFKPNTNSIWLMGVPSGEGGPMFFIVPDGPGLDDAMKGVDGHPRKESRQTTNSWGVRGAEPDLDAPVRGIVLGDSYMQGMFIGDSETPPECLRRYLQDHMKPKVSILNTGLMGYSPEQYYYTLIAFADRFRPHFVIVSVFLNDFGYMGDVGEKGEGDWEEGKYWLEKIAAYCDARHWPYLIVPAPFVTHLLFKRNSGFYPGTLTNILKIDSLKYLYPIEDFADAQLKLMNQSKGAERTLEGCALFNGAFGDSHFSAIGAEVWAESVGRRVILLLDNNRGRHGQHVSVRETKN